VGADAMDVLDQREIDLILTERLLPDMAVLSLLWCIKAEYPDVPVLVITESDACPVILEAMRLGAQDYLVKPFDAATLLKTVQRAIACSERRPDRSGNLDAHAQPSQSWSY
jgi:two-component system repressor protein LuxO